MKLTLLVDAGEGPYQVQTSLYVIVQWERKYKRKSSTIGEQGISIEDLAFMSSDRTAESVTFFFAFFESHAITSCNSNYQKR